MMIMECIRPFFLIFFFLKNLLNFEKLIIVSCDRFVMWFVEINEKEHQVYVLVILKLQNLIED